MKKLKQQLLLSKVQFTKHIFLMSYQIWYFQFNFATIFYEYNISKLAYKYFPLVSNTNNIRDFHLDKGCQPEMREIQYIFLNVTMFWSQKFCKRLTVTPFQNYVTCTIKACFLEFRNKETVLKTSEHKDWKLLIYSLVN